MGRGVSKAGGGQISSIKPIEVKPEDADDFFATKVWEDSLTDSEKGYVNLYTGTEYRTINQGLFWAENDPAKIAQLEDPTAISEIDSAISKATLKSDIIVHRGDWGEIFDKASADQINTYYKGKSFTYFGYASTSITEHGALPRPYMYRIHVKKGKGVGAYVKNLSDNAHELEFLLKRNARYKVLGAEKDQWGKIVVDLEMN